MAKKALKARVKLTPELWGNLLSWLGKQKTPPRQAQIAIFLGISHRTLTDWQRSNADLADLLDKVDTQRGDWETKQALAGKIPFNVWRFLQEVNHGALTEWQRQLLEIKRQELKLKTSVTESGTEGSQPIQINFEVKTSRDGTEQGSV